MKKVYMKNTGGLRLSVIIPTYNCKEYLDECLMSVLRQLPEDCELIATDDGSDDGTVEILSRYERSWDNLRVIYGAHGGASVARNAGLSVAMGDFVAFIDCDDCIQPGFLGENLPLLMEETDLFIFGIERILLSGIHEFWTVGDRVYSDASAFADEYIRVRQLMIYSNCNKFYRRSVIEALGIRFEEGVGFGEDRLFNYHYLTGCGRIVTSSRIMLRYIQRSNESMSAKHLPCYFTRVMELHRAKMDCFLKLSKGTSEEERLNFIAYDITRETEKTVERFAAHPEEKAENLPLINRMVFGGSYDDSEPVDVLIVLGSRNCEYKIRKAMEIGGRGTGVRYIVSGGNPHIDGRTEAEFMAAFLRSEGVDPSHIFLENRARYTEQNLVFSAGIINALRAKGNSIRRVGIVTAGFHIPRARILLESMPELALPEIHWFPAYGCHTQPDSWFEDPEGRAIVLAELRKTEKLRAKKMGLINRKI